VRPIAPARLDSNLIRKIGVATLSRLFLNTARRFPYPFAPALSRGMEVPLRAVNRLIAANQITGISGSFFAPLGDRWGYRVMLLAGLGQLGVGLLIDRFGWRSPFFVLGVLGLGSMVGVGLLIPGNRDGSKTSRALQSSHYGFWLGIKEFFGLNSIF